MNRPVPAFAAATGLRPEEWATATARRDTSAFGARSRKASVRVTTRQPCGTTLRLVVVSEWRDQQDRERLRVEALEGAVEDDEATWFASPRSLLERQSAADAEERDREPPLSGPSV
jgi:hypothetical protein